jgi:hypothetical protein
MPRSIIAVVVGFVIGFVLWSALFLALWFTLGVDGVLQKGSYEGNMAMNIGAPLCSILGGIGAGWLCWAIGRSPKAVYILAAILFIGNALSGVAAVQKPEPGPRPDGQSVMQALQAGKQPSWFALLNPIFIAGGALFGGFVWGGKKKTP